MEVGNSGKQIIRYFGLSWSRPDDECVMEAFVEGADECSYQNSGDGERCEGVREPCGYIYTDQATL